MIVYGEGRGLISCSKERKVRSMDGESIAQQYQLKNVKQPSQWEFKESILYGLLRERLLPPSKCTTRGRKGGQHHS